MCPSELKRPWSNPRSKKRPSTYLFKDILKYTGKHLNSIFLSPQPMIWKYKSESWGNIWDLASHQSALWKLGTFLVKKKDVCVGAILRELPNLDANLNFFSIWLKSISLLKMSLVPMPRASIFFFPFSRFTTRSPIWRVLCY